MTPRPAGAGDRAALEAEWLMLTREVLPGLARSRMWPVQNDHCFQRILLDAACGGCWYDHVRGRPARRMADAALLARAVALAHDVRAGRADLRALNDASLAARRARPPDAPRQLTMFHGPHR